MGALRTTHPMWHVRRKRKRCAMDRRTGVWSLRYPGASLSCATTIRLSPPRHLTETEALTHPEHSSHVAQADGQAGSLENLTEMLYARMIMDAIDLKSLYDTDELAWIEAQVAALRAGDLDRLDRANLIDCLIDMSKRERRELESRLKVLAAHVLKCRIQPPAARSWLLTIQEQQDEIGRICRDYPSLAARSDELLSEMYPKAVKLALSETGLDRGVIPAEVPTVQELLAFDTEPR